MAAVFGVSLVMTEVSGKNWGCEYQHMRPSLPRKLYPELMQRLHFTPVACLHFNIFVAYLFCDIIRACHTCLWSKSGKEDTE